MKFGFVKVAAATPYVHVADPLANSTEITKLIKQANSYNVEVLVFPELCTTGYTCGELFLSNVILSSVNNALSDISTAIFNGSAFFASKIISVPKKQFCPQMLISPSIFLPEAKNAEQGRDSTQILDLQRRIESLL